MSVPFVLAALLRPKPDAGEALAFMLAGFVLVMIVLTLMWLGTSVIGKTFIALDRRAAKAAQHREAERHAVVAAAAAATVSTPAVGDDDPRLVAVIAAAAQATFGSRAQVVSIRPAENEWSAEGRRQIFASRRTR